MRHDVRLLLILLVCAVSATFCAPAHAQGVYTSEDLEGVGDIETDLSGYAGTGCPATASFYSDLNGVTQNGVFGYNNIVQTVAATPGVTYIWKWGFTVYFTNPYTGYCDSYADNFTYEVASYITYYSNPVLNSGDCYYPKLACTSGNPTCVDYFIPVLPTGNPPMCTVPVIQVKDLMVNGACNQGFLVTPVTQGGACS